MNGKRNIELLPLSGKTIVVTRGKEQAKEFSQLLRSYGADVLLFTAVEIVDPLSWTDCDSALARSHEYSGIIFTSANAAEYFLRRAKQQHSLEQLHKYRVYAVGEKTKSTIGSYGLQTEHLPESFSAEQLAQKISHTSVAGERFLFPKGNLAKTDITSILSQKGIIVDPVTVYRTQEPAFDDEQKNTLKAIEEKADMITFFSPSSIVHYVRRASPLSIKKINVAVIGETTAVAARHEGMNVVLIAPQSSAEIFARSILHYYTT